MTANEIKAVMAKLDRLLDENDRLRAERDRLRKAMSDLLAVVPVFPTSAKNIVGLEAWYNKALQEARAALKGGGDE